MDFLYATRHRCSAILMGAVNNLLQTEIAVEGAVEFGYPKDSVLYLGLILFNATVLYAIPKTTFIGGLLFTAWLGGAVATHVIHNDPLTNILFPRYLRNTRVGKYLVAE